MISGKFCAIEALCEFQHSLVAARGHSFEDGAGALLDGWVEKTGGRSDLGELCGEIFVSVTNHSHVGRLEETSFGRKNEEWRESASGHCPLRRLDPERGCVVRPAAARKNHDDDGEFQHYVCSSRCGWFSTQPRSGASVQMRPSSEAEFPLREVRGYGQSPLYVFACCHLLDGYGATRRGG